MQRVGCLCIMSISQTSYQTSAILVRGSSFFSPDTDVAVLYGYHFSQLSIQELWFHTGTGRNRRFIPVHKAVEKVGQDVCNLLPAMHALTGCDSTSNLNGIGKKGGFTTLKKHKDDLVGLKNLGTDCTVISDETLTVYFKFIGLLYGEASNLNHLRYKLFTKKNLESSKLPPTEDRRCIVSCRRVGLSCTAACTCENECSSLQENDERR